MFDHAPGVPALDTHEIEELAWLSSDDGGPAPDLDLRLGLLHGFELISKRQTIELASSSQRLLALLAVTGRPLMRDYVAFTLWPDKSEDRAMGNLRSSLWRVRREGLGLVECAGNRIAIGREVSVDLRVATVVAERVLDGDRVAEARPVLRLLTHGDLLPDWYDAWIDPERERLRQLRLHALEALCDQLVERGDIAAAIEAGVAAVAAEPCRESSHRALIRAHLAEGNPAEALRQYESYRFTAHSELGILPSPQMEVLVEALRGPSARGHR